MIAMPAPPMDEEKIFAFERRRLRRAHTHEELDAFERHLEALVDDDLVTVDEERKLREILALRRILMRPGFQWRRFRYWWAAVREMQ